MPSLTRRQALAAAAVSALKAAARRLVHIVPNFHPASCGWLTNFSLERVYCANTYFDHLDRVRDDPRYEFVLSECNNMIAMLNFKPEREAELKQRIREGRVELVNAFFLESTINLPGGEALVRLGLEGLRWQQEVFGARPRWAWCIDVCGTHAQMPQITAGLGLEALIYTRRNPTGSGLHWMVSPDGTRTVALASGHYSDMRPVFTAEGALNEKELAGIRAYLDAKEKTMPAGAPLVALGGRADYSPAPRRKENPSAFLREWAAADPGTEIRFTTLAKYMDAVLPRIRSGEWKVPELASGTKYDFHAFWIQNPRVKTWFKRAEHALHAAEMLNTIASLQTRHAYPSRDLYHAWVQMFLNMDRNTLWGAAGGMVFEHDTSWDARDRFESVDTITARCTAAALRAMAGEGNQVAVFQPLNWRRSDAWTAPAPLVPEGVPAERLPSGDVLCRTELDSVSLRAYPRRRSAVAPPAECALPEVIETAHYTARIDPRTGALVSLRPKPPGREVLGGPANVIVYERSPQQKGDPGDFAQFRAQRVRLSSSSETPVKITARRGAVALTVTVEGACRRVLRFYHDHPRIDCETTLRDVEDHTVVVAEFPLAAAPRAVRRGIPYGFAEDREGDEIVPAVRWSHYQGEDAGLAILDRGLSGREWNGRVPVLYLLNASEKYYGYPNAWLSGKGEHVLRYALLANAGGWEDAEVARRAWEYNSAPVLQAGGGGKAQSWVSTSANVVVESMRRVEGDLEIRLVECLGAAGEAWVRLGVPHRDARLTDFAGGGARALPRATPYRFPVRPQQIVTLRCRVAGVVETPAAIRTWDALVPERKRAALHQYSDHKGHPPRGN